MKTQRSKTQYVSVFLVKDLTYSSDVNAREYVITNDINVSNNWQFIKIFSLNV